MSQNSDTVDPKKDGESISAMKKVYDMYENFSIKESIGRATSYANEKLEHMPTVAKLVKYKETVHAAEEKAYEHLYMSSDMIKEKYPYISKLSQSHGHMIVGGIGGLTYVPASSKCIHDSESAVLILLLNLLTDLSFFSTLFHRTALRVNLCLLLSLPYQGLPRPLMLFTMGTSVGLGAAFVYVANYRINNPVPDDE